MKKKIIILSIVATFALITMPSVLGGIEIDFPPSGDNINHTYITNNDQVTYDVEWEVTLKKLNGQTASWDGEISDVDYLETQNLYQSSMLFLRWYGFGWYEVYVYGQNGVQQTTSHEYISVLFLANKIYY